MSYSFSVRGATKDAAKKAVMAEFDKVVESQPIHAKDREQACTNAFTVIDLLSDPVPDGQVVGVYCNGYVSWRENDELTGANISASANYITPEAAS